MIKNILLLSILSLLSFTQVNAQNNDTNIRIKIEDYDSKNLNHTERVLLNILVQQSIDDLESDLKKLEADKEAGRITEEEFQKQKESISNAAANKISRSVDILAEAEDVIYTSEQFVDSFSFNNFDVKYTKDHNDQRSIQIQFENEQDCTEVEKKKISKLRDSFHFGIGFTNWLDENNDRFNDPEKKLSGGRSMYYELGIRSSTFLGKENPDKDLKYKSRTSVDYGISLISRYYHFNDKSFSINRDDNGINDLEDIQFTKSVFSQTALEVPLTLTHHFGKKVGSGFVVSGGLFGGLNLRSRQKIKYSINNEDYKAKWLNSFNTNRVYAGALGSIGFRNIHLTAKYNFIKLFKSSSDIEVYPYTIGVSIEL